MALVGDVIMGARELMTDLPPTLAGTGFTVSVVSSAAANLAPGTYQCMVTFFNSWGETLFNGTEATGLVVGGGQVIQVQVSIPPAGATIVRVYLTYPNNTTESVFQNFPVSVGGIYQVLQFPQNSGFPPSRATAYLPDSDGSAVSASAVYRWLNEGLHWAAAKNRGGLPDFGAAATVNGQPNYTMPGYWKKIDSAWYDGYPLGLLAKTNVFRRNPVTGYAGMLTIFQATDRLMVELWPQPSRTSCQTTLASPMAIGDTTAQLTSTANYVLGFGMTQIDSEIVNFAAINGNQLTGLQRGMCGTVPVAHSASSPVTELNLMIAGFRVPATYSVGQSTSTLYLPPGWDEALVSYMLYRFRKAEQDEASAKSYLQEATQKMSDLSANRIIAGPRQVTPFGGAGPEIAAGMGSRFGGIIVP